MCNKHFFSILLLGISFNLNAQQFSNTLSYQTSIIQLNSLVISEGDGYRYEGSAYHDHMMINDRQKFIYNLMYNTGEDNKPVYQAGNSIFIRLNKDQISDLYCFNDTLMIQDPINLAYTDTIFRLCQELLHDIKSLRFNETWSYNKSGSFFKKVNFFEPVMTLYNRNTGEEAGTRLLMKQRGGWTGFQPQSITKLIKYRVLIKDTTTVPTEIIKETERNTWVNMLYGMATKGKIKVYDPFTHDVQLKTEEIKNMLITVDSVTQYRTYAPYAEYDTVYVNSKWDQISAIDFYESWSFDKNGNFTKEVLAYQPLAAISDPVSGGLMGFMPVFLVYNNEKAHKKLEDLNVIWHSF
jgi:hypothetical protein